MIEGLIGRFHSTKSPTIVACRDFLARHSMVRDAIRGVLFVVRTIRSALRHIGERIRNPPDPFRTGVIEARRIGGPLTLSDMETLWQAAAGCKRALCLGTGAELDQIVAVVRRRARSITTQSIDHALNVETIGWQRDLVAVAARGADRSCLERIRKKFPDTSIFISVPAGTSQPQDPVALAGRTLRDKLLGKEALRIVMLNDVGFQYGAGTAHRRQAASFLLNGWGVSGVAWRPGEKDERPMMVGAGDPGSWGGMVGLPKAHGRRGATDDEIIAAVVQKISSLAPDVVFLGNYHGSGWPIGLLSHLKALGCPVVAYMHDTYWVTGRCAYPESCTLFRTGCDARCPTASEYPRLEPDKIAAAWRERAGLFSGPSAIPLVANSRWTHDLIRQRFGAAARSEIVHLGIDHLLFAPLDKSIARRILGIPADRTIVLMGAVNVGERWKGGPIFREVHRALCDRPDLGLVLFGRASERMSSAKSFGFIRDEGTMALLMNSADIFVSAATEESFGQTLLEASACGVPSVALRVGGVDDVINHGRTGLLVQSHSATDVVKAVDELIANPGLRLEMGKDARAKVVREFTLERQAEAWVDCLAKLC
jgi:glycosyltransferase involved in cell wall biosynthesis